MFICALVATAAKAQLDTLHVITPGGTGHITMTEQQCTVTWQERTYKNVMVRGRGHTFNAYPDKQPMRLRFQKKVALLDGGQAKKWTVLAMNDDPTLMRDAVAWFIAERMGMEYVPAHRYAVVTIDRRPQGICLIADHVEAGPDRVPVRGGGFLAELDGYADGRFFYTAKHHLAVRIHYPDEYGEEYDEVADRIIEFEENIDWKGLLPWYLTAEIIANPDTYWSLYFYSKDKEDGIHFGPIWDNGKGFGNDARFTDTEHKRVHDFAFNAAWGRDLAADSLFNAAVAERWHSIDRKRLLQEIEE